MDDPSFDIPVRPTRRFSGDTVAYEGRTVFRLAPEPAVGDRRLTTLVEAVLASGPYRHGDWFDLPMPLYLVHDEETADTFRVSVRDGRVVLHVLPETDSAGLRAFYDRLCGAADVAWTVECRADPG